MALRPLLVLGCCAGVGHLDALRAYLRAVAIAVGLAVALTVAMITQFAVMGTVGAIAASGALGAITVLGWLITLTLGPIATVQLWRLRRVGLYLAAFLCLLVATYFAIGLMFLRSPEAPLMPIVSGIVVNVILGTSLLSPAARRECV